MPELLFVDGRCFDSAQDASVPFLDRGYLLGDAIFETFRTYEGRPCLLAAHLERLHHGAEVVDMALPGDLDAQVLSALDQSQLKNAYVRVTVSRGAGPGGLGSAGYDHPLVSIWVKPWAGYPRTAYVDGIDTGFVTLRRIPSQCVPRGVKAAHYMPSILARRELEAQSYVEGIQLNVAGQVCCGTVSNLFIFRGESLITPPLSSDCLNGVTRAKLLELAPDLSFEAIEKDISPEMLHDADEVFFANSLMECIHVRTIEGKAVRDKCGERTKELRRSYLKIVT